MHVQPVTFGVIDDLECVMGPTERQELTEIDRTLLIRAAANSRHTFAGLVGAKPIFLGGVYYEGCVWMVATPGVADHRKFYLRTTKQQTEIMQSMFPVLWTCVDARYVRSLRWLEWLGFKIGETVEIMGQIARKVERSA